MNPEGLLHASDEVFRAAVDEEVHSTKGGHHSPAMRKALGGNDELANRWRDQLLVCKHSLVLNNPHADREHRELIDHVRGLIIDIATVRSLTEFNDEDFQDVVDGEARRVGGKFLRSLLSDPALIERWHLALVAMKLSVESQMCARADDVRLLELEIDNPQHSEEEEGLTDEKVRESRIEHHRAANAEFTKWRAGATRFKLGVDERLLEIERIRLRNGSFRAEDHAVALYMIRTLVDGIESHRAQMLETFEDDDISDVDRDLWKLIPG